MNQYHRIVVKLGTSVLTGGTRRLDRSHMVSIVRQCADVHRQGCEVIVCTSGAIAAGREHLGFPDLPDTIAVRQMLAAVGQSRLMNVWEQFFDIYDIKVGQMLLTREDVNDRHRYLNALDTMQELQRNRIIPIINENDAVATSEIKVGDNDNLSALVSLLADADLLLLLTDQPGLFTADPRLDPEAKLIPEVNEIDHALHESAGDSVSGLGIGGMTTKLQAADIARRGGSDVVIASGHAHDVIRRAVSGEPVGTRFATNAARLDQRRRWILAGSAPSGRVVVSDEVSLALRNNGTSLTPQGVVAIEGSFERGDSVSVFDAKSQELARGIARYDSKDLQKLVGCPPEEIADRLGYGHGPVVIHRNDLVLV